MGAPDRSCLVLGSGRSGTSMLGGMLAGAGYHMGSRPLATRAETNEKGFFEDRETVDINEELLMPLFPSSGRLSRLLRRGDRRPLQRGLRWAAELPRSADVRSTEAIDARIAAQVSTRPFCYKDPRFSYTLPAWRRFVEDVVFVCVFREPARTANSIVAEWDRHPKRVPRMTYERALGNWRAMYRRIVDVHRHQGEWVFVHYDQVLEGSALDRLEARLGARVDRDFPEARLKRAQAAGEVGPEDARLYRELCALAGMDAGT